MRQRIEFENKFVKIFTLIEFHMISRRGMSMLEKCKVQNEKYTECNYSMIRKKDEGIDRLMETGTTKMKKRTVQKSSASRRRGQQINSFNCGERVKVA